MFTGIVEEIGTIAGIERVGSHAARVHVLCRAVCADARHGDSICVSGVCLTVADFTGDEFWADVMPATLSVTTIGQRAAGDLVNLERAATPATRMGGHIVTGHVDGIGTVLAHMPGDQWVTLRIGIPSELSQQVAKKGSIAVDGTSLTVGDVGRSPDEGDWLQVSLIPTTLSDTTLGGLAVGSAVNIETDVLAKYVQRQREGGES